MPCVIGVDGGGSKTVARVALLDDVSPGGPLGEAVAGGSNWESVGVDGAVAAIATAVSGALAVAAVAPSDVVVAAFGLAGVDWPCDVDLLDGALGVALGALGLGGRRWVDNDVAIALRAGCSASWGVVSNVGTGTVTAGRNRDGAFVRTMAVGWGEPSGATGMARDALHAIGAAHHRTGPVTALTDLVLEMTALRDAPALFEALSRRRLRPSAAWAPLITRAAAAGDAVSRALLSSAGDRHGAMVVGVADQLGLVEQSFELALSGGVHRARDPWFASAFATTVSAGCPGAQPALVDVAPVHGAVLIARDLARV